MQINKYKNKCKTHKRERKKLSSFTGKRKEKRVGLRHDVRHIELCDNICALKKWTCNISAKYGCIDRI